MITIERGDVKFEESRDAGDPSCLCSRCLAPIAEGVVPIRVWPEDMSYEYRFHPYCVGLGEPRDSWPSEPAEATDPVDP